MCSLAARHKMCLLELMGSMLDQKSEQCLLGSGVPKHQKDDAAMSVSWKGMDITLKMLETRTWHSWCVECLEILLFQQVVLPDCSPLVVSQEEWSN